MQRMRYAVGSSLGSPEPRVILLAANYTIAVIGRVNLVAQVARMKERALDNIGRFFVR